MRVPLSWLKDYVDINLPAEALADRIVLLRHATHHIRYFWGNDLRFLEQF
jgi:hypothetical protein